MGSSVAKTTCFCLPSPGPCAVPSPCPCAAGPSPCPLTVGTAYVPMFMVWLDGVADGIEEPAPALWLRG